ncbi:hypothetical protein BDR06DRAFT_965370 [Suillus hirtellus]|nr:hypothetical protein BDR06DRAFT_965370 [Suillus hirtellus]
MTMLFAHNSKERTLQDFLALITVARGRSSINATVIYSGLWSRRQESLHKSEYVYQLRK